MDGTELTRQLMALARDPLLRQAVYEQLGEYCHQCRNRLNSLKLSLYLVKRQADASSDVDWMRMDRTYDDLECRVDRLQAICRPMTLSKIKLAFDLLIDDRRDRWTQLMATHCRDLVWVPPRDRAVAMFDVERLSQALDAVVGWRAGGFDSDAPAQVRWWVESGLLYFSWEEEATRARPTRQNDWTLPLLARVVYAHEGDVRVELDGGWRLRISWPVSP